MRPSGAVSPTEETILGVTLPLLVASRGPNAIALAYTAGTVVILGLSK